MPALRPRSKTFYISPHKILNSARRSKSCDYFVTSLDKMRSFHSSILGNIEIRQISSHIPIIWALDPSHNCIKQKEATRHQIKHQIKAVIKQNDRHSTIFALIDKHIARMGITMHQTVHENHLTEEQTQLATNLKSLLVISPNGRLCKKSWKNRLHRNLLGNPTCRSYIYKSNEGV